MGGQEIEQLIRLLGRLPGFGPRSARRVALYLLREPHTRLAPLARAMERAGEAIRTCSSCGNLDTSDPCHICTDRCVTGGWCVWWKRWGTCGRLSVRGSIGVFIRFWGVPCPLWLGLGRKTSTYPPDDPPA